MSVQILGADGLTTQSIDAVSKAARVTIYNSLGVEVDNPNELMYYLPIAIRQTAASIAGTVVWAMRNGLTKTIEIPQLLLSMGFDGAAAAGVSGRYELVRFSGATPAGGAAIVPVKQKSNQAVSTLLGAQQLDTGLTMTGATFEDPLAVMGIPFSLTGVVTRLNIGWDLHGIFLLPGEGLAIRLNTAAVIGMQINGCIHYDEA